MVKEMCCYLWLPRGSRHYALLLLVGTVARPDIFRGHETLERVESLVQWYPLARVQLSAVEGPLERGVLKVAAKLLLLDAQVTQDASHDVEVERHSSALDRADGHEVQHALGVEVLLAEAELLDVNVWQGTVQSLPCVSFSPSFFISRVLLLFFPSPPLFFLCVSISMHPLFIVFFSFLPSANKVVLAKGEKKM